MKINVRRLSSDYFDVSVTIDNTRIELGLMGRDDREELARMLREVADEITPETERVDPFKVALDALHEYQRNWNTGLPTEYAKGERIQMECVVEAVRDALNDAREA